MCKMIKIFVTLVVCLLGVQGHQFNAALPCVHDDDCKSLTNVNSFCRDFHCVCESEPNSQCKMPEKPSKGNPDPLVGRSCKKDSDCNLADGFCNSINMCACKNGFISASNNKRCLPTVGGLDSKCDDTAQCAHAIPNSSCKEGICVCIDSFYRLGDICHRKVDLGDVCESDLDCSQTEGAACEENTIFSSKKLCKCTSSMQMSDDKKRCLPTIARTTEECLDSKYCEIRLGKESECVNRRCYCRKGFHYGNSTTKCIRNKEHGNSCLGDSDGCYQLSKDPEKMENTLRCSISGFCECVDNYVPVDDICVFSGASAVASVSVVLALVFSAVLYLQ